MTVSAVQQLIFDLKRNKSGVGLLASDPGALFQRYELSPPEADALRKGDIAALYTMGVHPLLLAPFSRMVGMPRPAYQQAMEPLKGTRAFVSAYQVQSGCGV